MTSGPYEDNAMDIMEICNERVNCI